MKGMARVAVYIVVYHLFYLASLCSSEYRASKNDSENHNRRQLIPACTDPIWCDIPAPRKSLFGFTDVIEPSAWEEAKLKAKIGEQVLLSKVMEQFPHYLDFLDGDVQFRKFHYLADFFIDKNKDLSPLVNDHLVTSKLTKSVKPKHRYKWGKAHVLESDHDFYSSRRAPIFKVGYFAFASADALFYGGPEIGKAHVERETLLEHWRNVKDMVKRPFIALDVHDENWGLLSTHFPNRTSDWGSCCAPHEEAAMREFLDHNMTLMLVVNQHHNFSHPKIVTLPRGLPLHREHGSRIIWDAMRGALEKGVRKNKLAFIAASNSGDRPRILQCIQRRFPAVHLTVQSASSEEIQAKERKMGSMAFHRDYYASLATTRVGFALPGVGYDTYRLWELLTMGAVAVIERGVGLDKTVWRLPVLLVDDFADATPQLLRTAYVEAVYRAAAGQFEFQRLRQSYWYSFIMKVSKARNSAAILESFPMQAEDTGFTRPKVAYSCVGERGRSACGAGTKRTPEETC